MVPRRLKKTRAGGLTSAPNSYFANLYTARVRPRVREAGLTAFDDLSFRSDGWGQFGGNNEEGAAGGRLRQGKAIVVSRAMRSVALFVLPMQFLFCFIMLAGFLVNESPIPDVVVGDFSVGLFFIGWFMVAALGLVLMLTAALAFYLAGVHSLSGRQGLIKNLLFLFCLIGYICPATAFFPWLILWSTYVARHPE